MGNGVFFSLAGRDIFVAPRQSVGDGNGRNRNCGTTLDLESKWHLMIEEGDSGSTWALAGTI